MRYKLADDDNSTWSYLAFFDGEVRRVVPAGEPGRRVFFLHEPTVQWGKGVSALDLAIRQCIDQALVESAEPSSNGPH